MRFAAIALLFSLAACQPLPHPFADDHPAPNAPILTPPDSAGIVVVPVAGAPDPAAHDLAAAMADALQDEDVPASTDASNRNSYRLVGTATTKDAGGGNLNVTIGWEMREPGGAVHTSAEATGTMSRSTWQQGGAGVAGIAKEAAPALAKVVQSTAPLPVDVNDPLIAVHRVTGAPGDGSEALSVAMTAALRHAKVSLAEHPADKISFVVEGKVEVSKPADGKQEVKISWSLLDPQGSQLGQVNQENAVEAGSLDGAWGLTAFDVANAAAPGIAALIAEARKAGTHS
jgi:hypothetical protein